MRLVLAAILLLALPLAYAQADTTSPPSSPPPAILITPVTGDTATSHQIQATNLPPNASITAILFDPQGQQSRYTLPTDAAGNGSLPLAPPAGGWPTGPYRVALSLSTGRSVSAIFVADDGQPHLYAGPVSPSPWSAMVFTGTGLPSQTTLTLHLAVPDANLSSPDFQVTTDANGIFTRYIWPNQVGLSFFLAGLYAASLPQYNLTATLMAREHPGGADLSMSDSVLPGSAAAVHFGSYATGRYLWGVYAGANGQVAGEFLVGPTDARGDVDTWLTIPNLAAGHYDIATPYDWGEASFTVLDPPPTLRPTPKPTATPRPTATPKPTAKPKPTATRRPTARKTCTSRNKKKHAKTRKKKKGC